jgi:ABC-type polysaccharide/polyol phosphate export permease
VASSAFQYDSARDRLTILSEIREVYRYRDLLKSLIAKTIKSRYKRSVLGVAWTLLNPLINMAVLAIAFSTVFRGSVPHYPVYILLGLTAWNFFSQSTAWAMGQFAWGGALMKRVYVPPSIFAVACVGNGLVNIGFSLVPLVVIMLVSRHPFHATWWFLPVALLLLATFCLGVALLMSTLAVFFADVVDMYQLMLQAWFFLTPIIYPREVFPQRYAWVLDLNPMCPLLELFRRPIYAGELPDLRTLLLSIVWAALALAIGSWVFTKKADEFAYR